MFLGKSGSSISCVVTGPRRYSRDLPQGGLEIPCTLEFKGDKVSIDKVRKTENKQAYMTRPGVKVEGDMGESTKVDIAVEESPIMRYIFKYRSLNMLQCVQLLDSAHASISANVSMLQ